MADGVPSREEFAALVRRVYALELARQPQEAAQAADSVTAPAPIPAPKPIVKREPVFAPASVALRADETAKSDALSLEARVGKQWFSRIGVLAFLFGAAWLLKLAMDNGWLAPPERVVLGLAAGIGFLAWAELCWRRTLQVSAYALFAIGNGTLYLSLWAAFALYHLAAAGLVAIPMLAITAWNGYRAWANDARVFAVYALLLGYLIPILLANGENHEAALFSYLLMLGAATAALAVLKPWKFLLPAALSATILLGYGWYARQFSLAQRGATQAWVFVFIVFFMGACWAIARRRAPDDPDASLFTGILPAVVYFVAWISLLAMLFADWRTTQSWPMLLAALIGFAWFGIGFADSADLSNFQATQLAAGLALATMFLVLRFHGKQLVLALAAEGTLLMFCAARWQQWRLLRPFSICVLIAAWLGAATTGYSGTNIFWNPAMGTAALVLAGLALAAWRAHVVPASLSTGDDESAWMRFPVLAAVAATAALALLWIMGLRAIMTWWWGAYPGYVAPLQAAPLHFGSQFCYSAWCMVYGAVLLVVGFRRQIAGLRWEALILLSFAILKVFLYDVSAISQGYRVLSFFALGALLLAVSFAYQRDWLGLRRPPSGESAKISG